MKTGILCGLAICAGLTSLPAAAEEWSKTYSVAGRPTLMATTDDGAVDIQGWDQKRIEARVITQGYRIGATGITIQDHQTGDRVELDVKTPKFHLDFGSRSVRIELRVPRELAVDIRTGDGAIAAHALHGDISLKTGDGRIEADGLDGLVAARSGDGHIRLRGRFDGLTLTTGDGGVEVDAEPKSAVRTAWRLESGDGNIVLRLPEGMGAQLETRTGDGHIDIDLPLTANGVKSGSEIRGAIYGGGGTISVKTGDGSIRIGKL